MSSVRTSKNDGVSPIIGSILILAMTTVFVGIIGAAVVGGFGMAEPAPILGATIDHQGNIIMITHLNGDVLHAGGFKIMVDGVDRTAEFGATGDFGPGMTLSWDSGINPVGTVSIVCTSGTGSSVLITDKKFGKAAGAFEDRYEMLMKIIDWEKFVTSVADCGDDTIKLGTVFLNGGRIDYWVNTKEHTLSRENATRIRDKVDELNKFNIKYYMGEIIEDTDLFIRIDLTGKIYTEYDITSGKWKMPKPTLGSLYEFKDKCLYVCADTRESSGSDNPNIDPDAVKNQWIKIATVK